jgi:hypothetical protein
MIKVIVFPTRLSHVFLQKKQDDVHRVLNRVTPFKKRLLTPVAEMKSGKMYFFLLFVSNFWIYESFSDVCASFRVFRDTSSRFFIGIWTAFELIGSASRLIGSLF